MLFMMFAFHMSPCAFHLPELETMLTALSALTITLCFRSVRRFADGLRKGKFRMCAFAPSTRAGLVFGMIGTYVPDHQKWPKIRDWTPYLADCQISRVKYMAPEQELYRNYPGSRSSSTKFFLQSVLIIFTSDMLWRYDLHLKKFVSEMQQQLVFTCKCLLDLS